MLRGDDAADMRYQFEQEKAVADEIVDHGKVPLVTDDIVGVNGVALVIHHIVELAGVALVQHSVPLVIHHIVELDGVALVQHIVPSVQHILPLVIHDIVGQDGVALVQHKLQVKDEEARRHRSSHSRLWECTARPAARREADTGHTACKENAGGALRNEAALRKVDKRKVVTEVGKKLAHIQPHVQPHVRSMGLEVDKMDRGTNRQPCFKMVFE